MEIKIVKQKPPMFEEYNLFNTVNRQYVEELLSNPYIRIDYRFKRGTKTMIKTYISYLRSKYEMNLDIPGYEQFIQTKVENSYLYGGVNEAKYFKFSKKGTVAVWEQYAAEAAKLHIERLCAKFNIPLPQTLTVELPLEVIP